MKVLKTFSWLSVALIFIGLGASVKYAEPPMLEAIQYKLFDRYQAWHPREAGDWPVKIVDIDDASLSKMGQWPWPRTVLAELVNKLGALGAGAIVFDIVYAEEDRTSPKHMQEIWQLKRDPMLEKLPDHDQIFADAIAKWPVVVGSVMANGTEAQVAPKSGFAYVGDSPVPYAMGFDGVIGNIPPIDAAARGDGMLNSDPDADGILRRIPLVFRAGEQLYPALVVEALRVAQGAGSVVIKSVGASDEKGFGNEGGMTSMKIGAVEAPVDMHGNFWLYFNHSNPSRYVPAWQVFDGSVDPKLINGQIILIGTSAAGLKDLRSTPLDASIAGVEVHAQAIEQMLQHVSLKRPSWAGGVEALMLVISGLLALWTTSRFNAIFSALALTFWMAGAAMISWFAFTKHQLLLEPLTTIITVMIIYFATTVWRFAKTERERGRIKNTFSLYMSEALVEELAEHPEKLKLGGEKRNITIMFSDIRNFSAISERLEPEALTGLINRYLTPMTDVVLNSGGTIDKYMGDAIMAIWNAPLDIDGHPEKAVQAALTMRDALAALNAELAEDPAIAGKIMLPIKTGVGLNTGDCSVGNMGSNQRFEYSVLGHDVDLASRLEGLCKFYGVDIIISERTRARAGEVATIELDKMRVKGKDEVVHIHALLAGADLAKNSMFQELQAAHRAMLAAYRSLDLEGAMIALGDCRMLASHIPLTQLAQLYNLYESRIEEFQTNPPDADWDGVFTAEFK